MVIFNGTTSIPDSMKIDTVVQSDNCEACFLFSRTEGVLNMMVLNMEWCHLSLSLLSPPEELYFAKSPCLQLMTDKLFFTQNLYICLGLISAIKFHCQVPKTS
jgi:hypothetical protein